MIQADRVSLEGSGAFAINARRVDATNSTAFIVIARNASGLKVMFDWRGAALAFLSLLLLRRILRRR
jgi:hypothetical protein